MKAKDCPKCGSDDIWPEMGTSAPYGIVCRGCGFTGPRVSQDDPDEAIDAWNALSKAEGGEGQG